MTTSTRTYFGQTLPPFNPRGKSYGEILLEVYGVLPPPSALDQARYLAIFEAAVKPFDIRLNRTGNGFAALEVKPCASYLYYRDGLWTPVMVVAFSHKDDFNGTSFFKAQHEKLGYGFVVDGSYLLTRDERKEV